MFMTFNVPGNPKAHYAKTKEKNQPLLLKILLLCLYQGIVLSKHQLGTWTNSLLLQPKDKAYLTRCASFLVITHLTLGKSVDTLLSWTAKER